MTTPKCAKGYCTIPARTFTIGFPKGDPRSADYPQIQITQSKPWQLRQTEVTIDEYKAFLLKAPPDKQLQVVLKNCYDHKNIGIILSGKPKESESALLRRAKAIAGDNNCSTDNLKVDHVPKSDMELDWCKEMNSKPGNHPVVCTNQKEAEAFCASENAVVPTEFLLENASRGVSGTDKFGTPINKAITRDNGYQSTAPVCGPNNERANSFGVCDLAGNVLERTSSVYVRAHRLRMNWYYNTTTVTDPNIPVTSRSRRVLLTGGSFLSPRYFANAADRDSIGPWSGDHNMGFRCARPVPQDSK